MLAPRIGLTIRRPRPIATAAAVALALPIAASTSSDTSPSPTFVQAIQLQYQDRGNRREGIRPKPVAGGDIELISARVDYKEEAVQLPDRLRLKFYLDRPAAVHVTVREVDYVHYYWMDHVQPDQPWRLGFGNMFEWPTRDVIRQLEGLRTYDLGVVARLERPESGRVERVAPVILYYANPPNFVTGYVFTFRTNGDAQMTCTVYGASGSVFDREIPRQPGGRPFTVRWDATKVDPGAHSLVLRGHFLNDNARLEQTVSFYHQPRVQ